MWELSQSRFRTGLAALVAALTLAPVPACAGDIELFSPTTVTAAADVRVVSADGEPPGTSGHFGKLRYGDASGPRIGNADLVWQPRFGWAVSATVTASYEGGPRSEAGISEALFTVKPVQHGPARVFARVGLLWPPVSLEHSGADWHVADTITPSAINRWIGEEVRPLALEANGSFDGPGGQVALTAAVFTANDTAGALLALRGWALHDRKTLVGRSQPLPLLSRSISRVQPQFTHPTIYLGEGFAQHPGYYLKLAWAPAAPFRVELFHFDNRADPEDLNAELEWGWRTRFDQIAGEVRLGRTTRLKAQAMIGRSRMGFVNSAGKIWVDSHFRSAFGLVSHDFAQGGIALRGEAFATRQDGSRLTGADNEHGWATTLAGHWMLDHGLSIWLEALHVQSCRDARLREGLNPEQHQNQLQLVLRGRW